MPRALPATPDLALPSLGKGPNKVERRRWLLGGLSALAIAGLAAFHAALLAGRLADASIAHPEVLVQWVGALLLGVGAWALRRQGASLISGRGALVFWLLVLLSWLLKALLFAFWIVVVWRALRAHERIPRNLAATLRASVASEPPSGGDPPRQP